MNELWRVIPSCPLYEASTLGNLRRVGRQEAMKPHRWRTGYLQVGLWKDGAGKTRWVHRLVCEAFHGAPPSPQMDAAHGNGIKDDNRPENLRWATRQENEHAGTRNGQAILSEANVRDIRRRVPMLRRSSGGARIKKGELPKLAAEYGVTTGAIYNILYGTHWRHVS